LLNTQKNSLKITFHNPNTDEGFAKYLIKLIVRENAEGLLQKILMEETQGLKHCGEKDSVESR